MTVIHLQGRRADPSAGLRQGGRTIALYALLLLLLGMLAAWISTPGSLMTKAGLLSLPIVTATILANRRAAAYLLLVLLPFTGVSVGEGVGFFRWTTIIALAVWLLAVLLLEPELLRMDGTDVLVAAYSAVAAISVAVSDPDAAPGLLGAYLSIFGVYFVVSKSVGSTREARLALLSLCLGFGIASALALFVPGAASTRQSQGLVRLGMVGTSGNAFAGIDRFGGELVAVVVIAWTAFRKWGDWATIVARAASVVAFAAFIQTFSRAAVLSLIAAIVLWAVFFPQGTWRSRSLAAAALLAIAVLLAPAGLRERFQSLERRHKEALSRVVIWGGGVRMFEAHPLLGVGVGNFARVLPDYLHGDDLSNVHQDAHSLFVAAIAEMGLIGLALVLLLVGRLTVQGARAIRERSAARSPPGMEGPYERWRRIAAGTWLAFAAFLVIAATIDLSRDRFLFALAGLVHGLMRLGERLAGVRPEPVA
jgi:O-antigen ligase